MALPLGQSEWGELAGFAFSALLALSGKEAVEEALAALDSDGLLQSIVESALKREEATPVPQERVSPLLFLLSIIVQYTPTLNLTIVAFLTRHCQELDPFEQLKQATTESQLLAHLSTAVRLLDAQPCLREAWNPAAALRIDCSRLGD